MIRFKSHHPKNSSSKVIAVVKLLLLAPVRNAVSGQSSSALERLKNCFRSKIRDERLQPLILIHFPRDITYTLNLIDKGTNFAGRDEFKKSMFRNFRKQGINIKKSYRSVATQITRK